MTIGETPSNLIPAFLRQSDTASAALNPHWNEVHPLSAPNHDGSPQNGFGMGFGDAGNTLGTVVSATSTYPYTKPQPFYDRHYAMRGFLAVGVLLGSLFVLQLTYKWGYVSVVSYRDYPELASFLSTAAQYLVFVGAAVAAGLAFVLLSRVFRPSPSGPTYTCTLVGTDGFAQFWRAPAVDSGSVVPFEGTSLIRSRKITRIVITGAVNRVDVRVEASLRWDDPSGRTLRLLQMDWVGGEHQPFPSELAFWDACERAHLRHRLSRALHAVARGEGVRFSTLDSRQFVHVTAGRIDFSLNAAPFSVAPADILYVGMSEGTLAFRFANGGVAQMAMDRLRDTRVLLAVLSERGVKVT